MVTCVFIFSPKPERNFFAEIISAFPPSNLHGPELSVQFPNLIGPLRDNNFGRVFEVKIKEGDGVDAGTVSGWLVSCNLGSPSPRRPRGIRYLQRRYVVVFLTLSLPQATYSNMSAKCCGAESAAEHVIAVVPV